MRTFKVTWYCDSCCGIKVSVVVPTMTRRESERDCVISLAKDRLGACQINGEWFRSIEPTVVEVSN